jgi:methylenetetrahydrofolate reductase (NADPH)
MKIIDKINAAVAEDKIFYSFEYFPPKTEAGVENLYSRIERMAQINPSFIDITWGAGGSTAAMTIEIGTTAQNMVGIETQIHMTCTNMKKEDLVAAINKAKDNGLQNILCLRGDPPKGLENWEATEGGYRYAKDLVELIRSLHGNYFGICVAGYPEGHPNGDYESDLKYLKEKVDAGADFVITQLFYDCDLFLQFVKDCRKIGIKCPILPGIMPMHNYQSWKRMTDFCKTKIPEKMLQEMSQLQLEDDEIVKEYGIKVCIDMCKYLMQHGVRGFHFYTLNLEKSVVKILEGLELLPENVQRSLPWRTTANAKRSKETVRPIFWSNRPKSYIARTSSWDEFPNGRWGDSQSPAFGELNDFHIIGLYAVGSKEERLKMWGAEHQSMESILQVFCDYLNGKVAKLPWFDKPIEKETSLIRNQLTKMIKHGFITINSQPSLNAIPSEDKQLGWGPAGGYIYQKAYVEFFCSPEHFTQLKQVLNKYPSLTLHAVNMKGDSYTTNTESNANAVTWGVFPGKEIVQPTVVDRESFYVWKDEAFALWKSQWSSIYEEGSTSKKLIDNIVDSWWLVNVVDNDFIKGDIFAIFDQVIDNNPTTA